MTKEDHAEMVKMLKDVADIAQVSGPTGKAIAYLIDANLVEAFEQARNNCRDDKDVKPADYLEAVINMTFAEVLSHTGAMPMDQKVLTLLDLRQLILLEFDRMAKDTLLFGVKK